jgi:Icc-related predicted phosphoesterase
MRVMVVGDTHGDGPWMEKVTRVAGRNKVSWIIQVGDFGWFPNIPTSSGRPHSEYILETLDRSCSIHSVEGWIFIHDDLAALVADTGGPGFVHVGTRLWYASRGTVFTIGGVRFGALGGAVSMDALLEQAGVEFDGRPYVAGETWWPDLEAPTEEDVSRLLLNEPVQVLLAHEAPLEVDLKRFEGFSGIFIPPEILEKSRKARALVSSAIWALGPKVVIHGHWHRRYSEIVRYGDDIVRVEGLASNSRSYGRDSRAFLFIDLPEIDVLDGGQRR